MGMSVSRPATVCRMCPGLKTDVVAAEGRQVLRCRACRRTWRPYDTSPSPAPDYRTAYRTAQPEREEDEALAALEAGLDAATAAAKAADDPALRYATGLDPKVYAHVLNTPGALELIDRTAVQLRALADEVPVGRLTRLTVACQGGRHRSVAVAEAVGHRVWAVWGGRYGVEIEHHHVDRPVLPAASPA